MLSSCRRHLLLGRGAGSRLFSKPARSPSVAQRTTTYGQRKEPWELSSSEGESSNSEKGKEEKTWKTNYWKVRQLSHSRQVVNLAKKGRVSEAIQVLQQMKNRKMQPDVVVFNSLLACYGRQGNVKQAFRLFNELKKRGLLPTERTYSTMFSACGKVGPSASAELDKIRAEMERRDIKPNTIVTNALLSALALCGRHKEALEVYLDMEKMNLEPDICTFGSLLMTMSKDRHGGVAAAHGVWSEMSKMGIKADLHCYNMLLQVLRDGGLEGVAEGVAKGPLSCVPVQPPRMKKVPNVSVPVLQGLVASAGQQKNDIIEGEMAETKDKEEMVTMAKGDNTNTVYVKGENVKGENVKKAELVGDGKARKAGLFGDGKSRKAELFGDKAKKAELVDRKAEFVGDGKARKAGLFGDEKAKKAELVGDGKSRKAELFGEKAKKAGLVDRKVEFVGDGKARKAELVDDESNVVYVKSTVTFELCKKQSLILSVGSVKPDDEKHQIRWMEKSSVERFFAVLKQQKLRPNIHTFHLLAHLTLDPAHLLVTMKERRISQDQKLLLAAVTQQSKQLQSLSGAKVLLEYSKAVGMELGQAGYQAVAVGCSRRKDGIELLNKMKEDGVVPNQNVMGTLIGQAVRDYAYEYLTDLLRVMMHIEMKPNPTIREMLDTAASRHTKSPRQLKRHNGFKGFYRIWLDRVCPEEQEEEYYVV